MHKDILIHIGYQKTGTTWLQRILFSGDIYPFIPILGKPKLFGKYFYYNANELIDSLNFDKNIISTLLNKSLEKIDNIAVISNEDLSGNLFRGGIDKKEIADRLYSVIPNAKILITVREQASMIKSSYEHFLKIGGLCSIDDFMRIMDEYHIPMFNIENLHYYRLVRYYASMYGKTNIMVLPLELLRMDPIGYINHLSNFISMKISIDENNLNYKYNETSKQTSLAYYKFRYLNIFSNKSNSNARIAFGSRNIVNTGMKHLGKIYSNNYVDKYHGKIMEKIKLLIGDNYKEGNIILDDYTDSNLKEYGYY